MQKKSPTLYHRDVFMPVDIKAFFSNRYVKLYYTRNANCIIKDRKLPRPNFLTLTPDTVLEVGYAEDSSLADFVVELPQAPHVPWNLFFSVAGDWMQQGAARVRTVWTYPRGRDYKLDTARYVPNPAHQTKGNVLIVDSHFENHAFAEALT